MGKKINQLPLETAYNKLKLFFVGSPGTGQLKKIQMEEVLKEHTATETELGVVKLSTQVIIQDEATTDDQTAVTPKKFWLGLQHFLTRPLSWLGKQEIKGGIQFIGTAGEWVNKFLKTDGSGNVVGVNKIDGDDITGITLEKVRAADNKIAGNIDADGNQIDNLANAITNQQAVTLNQLTAMKQEILSEVDTSGFAHTRWIADYDPATNGKTFPSSGSGAGGAVRTGDTWDINTAGGVTEIHGIVVETGDTIRAKVDNPGQTIANWHFGEGNIGQATESVLGKLKISSKSSIEDKNTTNNTDAVTPLRFWQGISILVSSAWNWTAKQTFGGGIKLEGVTTKFLKTDANGDVVGADIMATDGETQITAAIQEDEKFVTRLKLFNWWAWVRSAAGRFKLSFLSGTESRLVQASSTGELSAPSVNRIEERVVTDADIISALLAATFTRSNYWKSVIAPANGKVMLAGKEYFQANGQYVYRAISDNFIQRLNNFAEGVVATTNNVQMQPNTLYVAELGSQQTFFLPPNATVGDEVEVVSNAASTTLKIIADASQTIRRLSSTGTVLATTESIGTAVKLKCVGDDLLWSVVSQTGTISIT